MPNQTMHRPCPEPSRGRRCRGGISVVVSFIGRLKILRIRLGIRNEEERSSHLPWLWRRRGGERARGAHRIARLPHCRYLAEVKDDEQRISFIKQSGERLSRALQQANPLPLWSCVQGEKALANALVVMVSIFVCFSSC